MLLNQGMNTVHVICTDTLQLQAGYWTYAQLAECTEDKLHL